MGGAAGAGRAALVGTRPGPVVRGPGGRLLLDVAVGHLYRDLDADPRVAPLLHRLLACTRALLATDAGAVIVADPSRTRPATVEDGDRGGAGRLGEALLLEQATTGQVFPRRGPLVVDGAAVAPLWWQGEVVAVNVAVGVAVGVAVADGPRRFTPAELVDLELLTQAAAPALARAAAADPAWPAPVGLRAGEMPPDPAPACPLTQREDEVLRLLADGLSDREVAARLVISHKTVQKHVGAVLRKSGTTSRTAAVVHGLRCGWLS